MKKILLLFLVLILTGCQNITAKREVEVYLDKFKNHDPAVKASLDELLTLESITNEQKEMYRLIMKKQYTDLDYKVVKEHYNGDEATVEVLINVYDYNASKKRAIAYIKEHQSEFPSEVEIMNRQLKEMQKEQSRVKYTLIFNLNYIDNTWRLQTPNTEILEKIHGIYVYEKD